MVEEPREQDEVEGRRQHADHRKHHETDEDLRALGSAQQTQHVVQDDRDYRQLDELAPAQVTRHLLELDEERLDHLSVVPMSSASNAICA